MARSCHWLERHGAHLVTDVTCTFFGKTKRKWLNEHIPIPTNAGNRAVGDEEEWQGLQAGRVSPQSPQSCFRYLALNINNPWRKFFVTAFSIKLLRAGWVPTTKSRLQMKQWSRQRPLEVSSWIHSVSCNCLEASEGRCRTQISLTLQPSLSCLVLPWKKPQCHYKTSSKEYVFTSLSGVSKPK